MFIEDVKEKFNNGDYDVEYEYLGKKKILKSDIMNPLNPVYDDSISIRELKNRVDKYNEKIDEEIKIIKERNKIKKESFYEDIINAIMEENCAFNKEQAKIIYEYIYNEYHSSMHDFFIYLENFIEVISNIIKAK